MLVSVPVARCETQGLKLSRTVAPRWADALRINAPGSVPLKRLAVKALSDLRSLPYGLCLITTTGSSFPVRFNLPGSLVPSTSWNQPHDGPGADFSQPFSIGFERFPQRNIWFLFNGLSAQKRGIRVYKTAGSRIV
jgi:hypothetical protein